MYYVGCLPQSLTPCSNHYWVLPSVVHDMCNVIIHVINGVWLSVCSVMVDMMNTPTLQCTTVARC